MREKKEFDPMVVVVFVLIVGLLALVVDFREVMLTSPPDLAQCAPPPTPLQIGLQ